MANKPESVEPTGQESAYTDRVLEDMIVRAFLAESGLDTETDGVENLQHALQGLGASVGRFGASIESPVSSENS